ncbi:hypothetical protein [Actinomadura sp. B10D3]|uniref:hypothetical protein n=1 Tax=Actinomadura sp. B10D3 TaxID=3153557 RepID=UPI00325D814D
MVWALVLTVFYGLALLSGQTDLPGSGEQAPAKGVAQAQAVPAQVASAGTVPAQAAPAGAVPAPAAGEQVLAAPAPVGESAGPECTEHEEQSTFLPLNRWTSLELHVVDNSTLFKVDQFVSMISELMFMASGLCWQIIGTLMAFGFSFDVICTTATPINSVTAGFAQYATWLLIPAWVFVLMTVVRRGSGGQGRARGPASAARLIMVFLAATGMIYFIGDQADRHRDDPTAAYTVPWMSATVQGWFGEATDALYKLELYGLLDDGRQRHPVFYDDQPVGGAGLTNCAALDRALYDRFLAKKQGTSLKEGRQALVQVSKMWEITLLRSWQTAQFGEGTTKYPAPAHASCRWLEANSSVDTKHKIAAYDLSIGKDPKKHGHRTMRDFYLDPPGGEQTIMVAWGACRANNGKPGNGATLPQWDEVGDGMPDRDKACAKLYSQKRIEDPSKEVVSNGADGDLKQFYFNGEDELSEKLGKCYGNNEACQQNWDFVSAWLGRNHAERLTHGLMSLVVSVVFLLTLGPLAAGMTVSSIMLMGLVMLLPITLLLLGMGLPQGKRILKLTGAALASDFLLSVALTIIMLLTGTGHYAVMETIGENTAPNLFEQILLCAVPLAALYLARRIMRAMGVGDVSTVSGAIGFATAVALKGSGDRRLARDPHRLVRRELDKLGLRKPLKSLDEKELQWRRLDNPAARWLGRKAGDKARHGASRVTRPVANFAKDKYGRLMLSKRAAQKWVEEQSPYKRAGIYGAATLAMGGVSAAFPGAALLTVPLMSGSGRRVVTNVAQGLHADARDVRAAGLPQAKDARSSLKDADAFHRQVIRIHDDGMRRDVEKKHNLRSLERQRARMWGDEFNGFASDEQKMAGQIQMAKRLGVKPDSIMVSSEGLVVPVPGADAEFAGHWVNHLPSHVLRRREGEVDDQWIARICAQASEAGYINDLGENVDVYAAHGLDTSSSEVRDRIASFFAGGNDAELSKIRIDLPRAGNSSETARDWLEQYGPNVRQRWDADEDAIAGAVAAARRELENFPGTTADLPTRGTMTAAEIRGALDAEISTLNMVIERGHGSGDYASGADDQRILAREIEELGTALRDLFDSSSQARTLSSVRARVADPSTSVGTEELSQEIQRITDELRQGQEDLQRDLDRAFGSISRKVSDEDDARSVQRDLDELKRMLEERFDQEEENNREVVRATEELERRLDGFYRLRESDPRFSAPNRDDIRNRLGV